IDVHTLRFIRQARVLGFSIKQIAELLGLWRDQRRPSRKVKALALAHVAELDERIRELEAMKQTLQQLAEHCRGDERPECPILERLADSAADPRPASRNGARARSRALHRDPCH
ncbi:MAG TPA: MerR family DNA-binding protein, partial [Burkholderiales bacterium]|nr:MerR family DNA-binding protein [Burkholderiales bacterium]